eukprot:TRINITY_DN26854_c0_g1_i1.p1 TRINITY_DN26854_c0_g1~~TRINITY_DN26854_c0_g1_i1.p1  ORF type:complete len:577 (+),score=94.03 TRINITY_DN26854_c0_g1_i1:48-1733(+)
MSACFQELLTRLDAEHVREVKVLKARIHNLEAELCVASRLSRKIQHPSEDNTTVASKTDKLPTKPPNNVTYRQLLPELKLTLPNVRVPNKSAEQRRAKMQALLNGARCDIVCGCLILLDTIIVCLQLQLQGYDIGHALNVRGYSNPAGKTSVVMLTVCTVAEYAVTVLFTLELVLRLWAFRLNFFRDRMNVFDAVVVIFSLFKWLADLTDMNPLVVRVLKLCRIARMVRFMKFSSLMDNMLLLVKCLAASVGVLAWSLCILVVVQCVAGVLVSQAVFPYLLDSSQPVNTRTLVFGYYGTFSRSMLTMFEITFANWAPPCRVLVDNISEAFTTFFLVYRCLVGFCVLNVVQAVFLQQTMKVAQEDTDVMIMQKKRAHSCWSNKLAMVFSHLDCSGDGFITRQEFADMLMEQETRLMMQSLDIEIFDMELLFRVLAGEDSVITIDEFIDGAARIKGSAKAIETIQILEELRAIQESVGVIEKEMSFVTQLRHSSHKIDVEKNVLLEKIDDALVSSAESGSGEKLDEAFDIKICDETPLPTLPRYCKFAPKPTERRESCQCSHA